MVATAGAAEARFGAQLEGLREPLFEFLRRLTRDYHAAQDLTQETFLRAILLYRAGSTPDRLSGWIFRVAYRAALDGMRRRRRVPTVPFEGSWDSIPEGDPDPRPPDVAVIDGRAIDRDRLIEEVRGAVFALPSGTRELFLARYGSGQSCREAAAIAGVSPANAKIRMMRGRRWIARRVLARLQEEAEWAAAVAEGPEEWKSSPAPLAVCAGA